MDRCCPQFVTRALILASALVLALPTVVSASLVVPAVAGAHVGATGESHEQPLELPLDGRWKHSHGLNGHTTATVTGPTSSPAVHRLWPLQLVIPPEADQHWADMAVRLTDPPYCELFRPS